MSYGLLYTLPFRDIRQKLLTVKVEQWGYTGVSKELKGQRSPFTVSVDDEDFLYTPLRMSTATLHVFGADYLQNLFSTDYRMNRVTLYEEDKVIWCGYVKPELYTQDFRHVKFPLDIECYSAMSVLEYIDYNQKAEVKGFVSLWELLKLCVTHSRGLYEAIYVPHVYATDVAAYGNWNNVLEQMKVSEQNFFDEDGKAMTLKEVLENVMRLMNWTCVDWQGSLYFVDMDNVNKEYYKYEKGMRSYTKGSADALTVQDIGFSASDHTLDIVPGYNKVTVRCSNYPVGDALPDMGMDSMLWIGGCKSEGRKGQEVYHKVYRGVKFTTGTYELLGGELKAIDSAREKEMFAVADGKFPENLFGCFPEKYDVYALTPDGKPDIVDYDFSERWLIPASNLFVKKNDIKLLQIRGAASAYASGALYFYSNFAIRSEYFAVIPSAMKEYEFRYMLRIGNNYYHAKDNGEYKWDNNPDIDNAYPNNIQLVLKTIDNPEEYPIGGYNAVYEFKTQHRALGDGLEGVKGLICKTPESGVLSGELEFILYAPVIKGVWELDGINRSIKITDYVMKDFKFGFKKEQTEDEADSDRLYENVINEDYINPLEDIEMKISSYNDDGACYSKVLLEDVYLKDNLYNGITAEKVRPEEFLIRRIINQYSATRFKLSLAIKRGEIKPFTVLTDWNTPGKKYVNIGGEIDYQQNKFNCVMLETAE